MTDLPTSYLIRDRQTGATVGQAKTRLAAVRAAERRNVRHGAHRYEVRAVYGEQG